MTELEKRTKSIERSKLWRLAHPNAWKITAETGIKHEVDHIIPIKGKNVSGLHVPWNLQILTKSKNAKKRNRVIL